MKYILLILTITFQTIAYAQDSKIVLAEKLIAADSADYALELLKPIEQFDVEFYPKVLSTLANAYFSLNDNASALEVYERALEVSRSSYDRSNEIEALYWLTRISAINGDFDQAIKYGELGAYKARFLDDEVMEFRINNLLSWAYFSKNIDFNKVLVHQERQIYLVKKIDNEIQKAHIYNNLGYDLTVAGTVPLDSSIALMTYANNIYAQKEGHQGRWYTLMNLTWQHRLKGDYEKAIALGELSLAQALKDNDRHSIIEASFQLGESLLAVNRISDASQYYGLGSTWRGDKEDRDSYVFDVYHARFLWVNDKKEAAISKLEKAIDFLQTSEVFYEMHGRALVSQYYIETNRSEEAENHIKKIDTPRHNYIALETKFHAAVVNAQIMNLHGNKENSIILMKNWHKMLESIGANQLIDILKKVSF